MFEKIYFSQKKKILNHIFGFFNKISNVNVIFKNIIYELFYAIKKKVKDPFVNLRLILTHDEILLIVSKIMKTDLQNILKTKINNLFNLEKLKLSNIQKNMLSSKGFKHLIVDKFFIAILFIIISIIPLFYIFADQDYFFNDNSIKILSSINIFLGYEILTRKIYYIVLMILNLLICLHIFNYLNNILTDYIIDNNIKEILYLLLGGFSILACCYYFSLVFFN